MGQLKNTWKGPVVGRDYPHPQQGMISQNGTATSGRSGGLAGDPRATGSPIRYGELVQDTFEDQMAGMIHSEDHKMNTADWPVEGNTTTGAIDGSVQVPNPLAMDKWDGVEDEAYVNADGDAAIQTWTEGYASQTGAMKTADNMGETKIRKDEIHHDALHKGAMSRQPEDAIGGGAKLSDGPMKGFQAPHLSQRRLQGLISHIPGFESLGPSPRFVQPASGEVDLHRRAVEMANGFQMPVQYSMKFNCPKGISQPKLQPRWTNGEGTRPSEHPDHRYKRSMRVRKNQWVNPVGEKGYVEQGGLDWQSHIMNSSISGGGEGTIRRLYSSASQAAETLWDPQRGKGETEKKQETLLNLFCSKVSMPEKSINFQSLRQYGTHFAYPQSVSFGTLSTTFYCDASMHIKKFFDAWQKLIFNDITGNFNYYDEYTSEFDIFTRAVVGVSDKAEAQKLNGFEQAQQTFREGSFISEYNEIGGVLSNTKNANGPPRTYSDYKYPKMEFRNTYGVKVMECWPQIVGSVDLGHASTNSIAEFTVTWAYKKWNTFNLGEIGKRGRVNLSNSVLHEKGEGIPFVQDMPQELRGPLTQHADQSLMSMPQQRGFSLTG